MTAPVDKKEEEPTSDHHAAIQKGLESIATKAANHALSVAGCKWARDLGYDPLTAGERITKIIFAALLEAREIAQTPPSVVAGNAAVEHENLGGKEAPSDHAKAVLQKCPQCEALRREQERQDADRFARCLDNEP